MNVIYKNKYLVFCLAFIFLSIPAYAQKILKGPYLIEPGEKTMSIRWETDGKIRCSVRFGLNNKLNNKAEAVLLGIKNGGYLYEAKLEGLKPNSDYYYKVIDGSLQNTIKTFKTSSRKLKHIRFVAMGDSRSNPAVFKNIVDRVESENPDFIISMGDLVENGGTYNEWEEFFFSVANDLIDHVPLVSTLGDHEGDGDDGELFRHFLRTDQQTEKQWFSFDYGSAHLISLDYRHPDDEEMIKWFVNDISSSEARWKFVFMHRPCYNLGGHRSVWGREHWPELFRKYQVDIVFAGHSHQYERFYPLRPLEEPDGWPVTYITTGGAGAGLYEVSQNSFLAKAESVNHYVYFEISGDTLRATAIRNDNSILDEFEIIKHGNYFDLSYLSFVKPQEDLDILTMFTRAVSLSLNSIPLKEVPSKLIVKLNSKHNLEIPYTIQLNELSEPFYTMDKFSSILKRNEKVQIPLEIYGTTDITISKWGEIKPELRIDVIFEKQSKKYTLTGGEIEYWPDQIY